MEICERSSGKVGGGYQNETGVDKVRGGSKVWPFCDNVIIEFQFQFPMQFFQRKFAVTSVMKIYVYLNMGNMGASGLRSFLYSINFQIRQIPVTNQRFSWEQQPFLYQA